MNEKGKYLGIDIGTTSLKAAVFNGAGERLAFRTLDYTLHTDGETGFIEFPAEEYITMCKSAIDELIAECGGLDAISVDTQGETLILADADGGALAPAVVWLDNRADKEANRIRDRFGNEKVYAYTGQPEITAGWPASKLLWFREHQPDLWQKVGKIFMLEDWVLYRLTGNFVTEPTVQSSSLYYDIQNRCWWGEMLDFLGVSREQLPTVVKTAEKVGKYKGIPVVSGMLDQIAGTIGAGVTDDTRISEMTGTIMAICALTDEIPAYRADSIIPCHVHAIEGKYCRLLWSSTAGMALKWFRAQLAEEYSFAELDRLAADVPAGCGGLTMLPYFCGSTMPKYDPDARAVFAGLDLSHTRGHLVRSIMEAVAFTLRMNLMYIGMDAIHEIRITGGGAKSPLWAQIKADVTGKPLKTVSEEETACLGTALAAAVGIGHFADLASAAAAAVQCKHAYAPSGVDYSEAYARYCALDKKMNE